MIILHIWGSNHPPIMGGINRRFQAKRAKYFHTIKTTALVANQEMMMSFVLDVKQA